MFFNNPGYKSITPDTLRQKIAAGDDFLLLDVRTPQENAAQAIDGSYLIPVQELGSRLRELPKDREIVVYCRVGNRSAFASSMLARLGYKVVNLDGGIMLWNMSNRAAFAGASR